MSHVTNRGREPKLWVEVGRGQASGVAASSQHQMVAVPPAAASGRTHDPHQIRMLIGCLPILPPVHLNPRHCLTRARRRTRQCPHAQGEVVLRHVDARLKRSGSLSGRRSGVRKERARTTGCRVYSPDRVLRILAQQPPPPSSPAKCPEHSPDRTRSGEAVARLIEQRRGDMKASGGGFWSSCSGVLL